VRPNGRYEPTPRGESGTIIAFNGHKLPIFIEPEPNDNPIHCLVNEVRDYIYLTDPQPLYTVLGVIAANMISGNPVWLMIVGPPASGKTMMLMAARRIPGVHRADSISGPAALLSGTPRKEKSRDATGGLLHEMGPHGCLVIEDFTSAVLELPQDTKKQILTAFRLAHKGDYSRKLGNEGGREIHWSGKLALLAAGTTAADRMLAEVGPLGERWLIYRQPRTDGVGESKSELHDRKPQQTQKQFQEAVAAFMGVIGLNWPCAMEGDRRCRADHRHFEEEESRNYSDREERRLIGMAQLVVKMRSGVYRHPWNREIEDKPEMESPPRVAGALGQFYLGLERIGLNEAERWSLVSKVAMDSCPSLRADVIRMATNGGVDLESIPGELHVGGGVVKRTVEELLAFGMVKREGRKVMLKNGVAEEMERYFT